MPKNILIHQTTVKKTSYLCPKLKKTNGKRSPRGAVAHFSRDTIINSHRAIWQNFIFGDMKKLLLMTVLGMLAVGGMEAQNESGSAALNQKPSVMQPSMLKAAGDYWMPEQAAESYAGGTGTEADPYQIATPEQFIKLCNETPVDGSIGKGIYFKQTADIDFSALKANMVHIGLSAPFAGVYDGGNFTIKGIRINQDAEGEITNAALPVSLFIYTEDATIKNLSLEDIQISYSYNILLNSNIAGGMLVYDATNTVIENCHVNGDINVEATGKSSGAFIGGIGGFVRNSTIDNCTTDGSINITFDYQGDINEKESYSTAGGITTEAIGETTIKNSTSNIAITNNVKGTSNVNLVVRTGGITTWADNIQLLNSNNTGALSATGETANHVQVGGLISCLLNGYLANVWNASTITSVGGVEGENIGGIVAYMESCNTTFCAFDSELSGIEEATELKPGNGFDTDFMQSQDFVDRLNSSLPEDCLPWQYVEGSYPVLGTSEEQPEDPTASESISKSDITFRTVPGAVVITAPKATQFAAYTFTGAMQATQLIPAGTTTVNLPAGLYILKIGEETHKVNVK